MAQEQKIMLPPDVNTQQLMMILNHVYPVGSYYETSDEDFDPNDSFVGEWSLEESGRVHVSAGTGYTIGSKGGSTEVPYHTHTLTRSTNVALTNNHSVTITQPSFTMKWTGDASSTLTGSNPKTSGNVMRRPGTSESTLTMTRATNVAVTVAAHAITQPVFTCGYAGTSGNNNMQPYIVVNRWHRDR